MNKFINFINTFFRNIALSFMSIFLTLVIVGGCFVFCLTLQLPNTEQLKDVQLQIPLRIYTSDNKLIGEFGEKKRNPVTLAQVPRNLIQAVIDTEDKRFYKHSGVDIIGLIRALRELFITGKKVQGASTITMQVARNFFLTRKKTYIRKFREILLAIKIDREFSKNEILSLYLNKVYFGEHAYGVAAAAKIYYGKPLNKLTLPEMAMLAGLPQAPSKNNPIVNPHIAIQRRDHVLECMLDNGDINESIYQKAIQAPITAKYHNLKITVQAPYVAEMVRLFMIKKYGEKAYEKGFRVYTTIHSKLQEDANWALQKGLLTYTKRHGYRKPSIRFTNLNKTVKDEYLIDWQKRLKKIPVIHGLYPAVIVKVNDKSVNILLANGKYFTIVLPSWIRLQLKDGLVGKQIEEAGDLFKIGDVIRVQNIRGNWVLSQVPQVTGAIVALNPKNGAILALDGGYSYNMDEFNNVIQANRQPGSAFKPFIYSAALAKGLTLASLINDAPIVVNDSGANELWRPQNASRKFYGPTRLRIGLIKSRNLVSIRLLQNIGISYVIDYVQRFGFNSADLPKSLSLALGTGSVTPLELANGYAVFANGGYKVQPFFIDKIENNDGKIIFQSHPPAKLSEDMRVITPQNAYLMTSALKDVIRDGTGRGALILKRSDLAGKTGTTNDRVDAWFSGFNGDLVTTVWIGYKQPKSLHEYGAQAALPIWINFMRMALIGKPENSMEIPADIVTVRIDPINGLLAYPGEKNAIFEMFRKQYVPTQVATNIGSQNRNINNNETSETQNNIAELF